MVYCPLCDTYLIYNIQLIINSIKSGEINQTVVDVTAGIGINCEKESYPDTVISKKLGKYKAVLVASPFADKSLFDFTTQKQTIQPNL